MWFTLPNVRRREASKDLIDSDPRIAMAVALEFAKEWPHGLYKRRGPWASGHGLSLELEIMQTQSDQGPRQKSL